MKKSSLAKRRLAEIEKLSKRMLSNLKAVSENAKAFNQKLRAYNLLTDGDSSELEIEDALEIVREMIQEKIP